jgi:hypothetical protein
MYSGCTAAWGITESLKVTGQRVRTEDITETASSTGRGAKSPTNASAKYSVLSAQTAAGCSSSGEPYFYATFSF